MENKEQKKEKTFDFKKEIREWFFILLTAAGIALFLNTFIIANSRVPSNSMETTIMTGDLSLIHISEQKEVPFYLHAQ